MQSSVRYLEIPTEFKKYINTWDKFPFDFKAKIATENNGRYFLKEKYLLPETTIKPKKKDFEEAIKELEYEIYNITA